MDVKARDASLRHRQEAEKLFHEHRMLVDRMIHRLDRFAPGMEREDWVSVALIALWQAALKFDPRRRVSFACFATIVIKRAFDDVVKTSLRQCRSANRRTESLSTCGVDHQLLDPADPFNLEESVLDRLEGLQKIREWPLSKLERFVFVAQYLLGYSYKEMIQMLKSKGQTADYKTIDNALQRAKRRLRKAFPDMNPLFDLIDD